MTSFTCKQHGRMFSHLYDCIYLSPLADMGVERCVRLDGLTDAQINEKLEGLAKAGVAL